MEPGAPTDAPIVRIRSVSKTFAGSRVLDRVDLTIRSGEIHALLGHNGSGKSTLIKILSGYHQPDAGGVVKVRGENQAFPLPVGAFRRLGMQFVHQDLALIPSLTVLENFRMGALADARSWFISWQRERRVVDETLTELGLEFDARDRVDSLSSSSKALLAVARAIGHLSDFQRRTGRPGLLVLDEPTPFLSEGAIEKLFGLMRTMAATGHGVLFVSHDLSEVKAVSETVTVLRDGKVVSTVATSDASVAELIRMIVGHDIASSTRNGAGERHPADSGPTFAVRDLRGGSVRGIGFDLFAGEVVGVAGQIGSGAEDLPYLLYGAQRAVEGKILVGDGQVRLAELWPGRARQLGFALVPGDRLTDGAALDLSVLDNVTMPVLHRFLWRAVWLRRRLLLAHTRHLLDSYDIRPSDPHVPFVVLSGGNQQRAVVAKWLQTEPRLLILHEPTQGVDVGAREHILSLIRAAARSGACVLCVSSDHDQLSQVSDRVLVIGRGRIATELRTGELTKARITEEALIASASGSPEQQGDGLLSGAPAGEPH